MEVPTLASETTTSSRRFDDSIAAAYAGQFLDALMAGDGTAAAAVVDHAMVAGGSPESVQALVLAPAMDRIGDMWEEGSISVADEHLATAITQRAMVRLFEEIAARQPRLTGAGTVLLAAVEGQRHVLGLRMIADVLEGAGFDVRFLGEDVPVAGIREYVARNRPDLVGLSHGVRNGAERLAAAIVAIHEEHPGARVILGGRAVPEVVRAAGYPVVASSLDAVLTFEATLRSEPFPPSDDIRRLADTESAGSGHGGSEEMASRAAEAASEAVGLAEQLSSEAFEAAELAREHVRRAEHYRSLAFRDTLTGLGNRRAFEERLIELREDRSSPDTILMIDVDDFKAINDRDGHAAGDANLISIGRAVTSAVRSRDLVARVGGDEFAVILPGTDRETAVLVAHRVIRLVRETVEGVSVSVGVANLTEDTRGAVLSADMALHRAKAEGKNRVMVPADAPGPDGHLASGGPAESGR